MTETLNEAVLAKGFHPLYDNGLRLSSDGCTTLHEVQRVLYQAD